MSLAAFRRYLEHRVVGTGWLRLQTSLVLLLSFLVGWAVNHLMLIGGLSQMAIRLPLTVLVAYGAFLVLVRGWLWLIGIDRLQVKADPAFRETAEPARNKNSEMVERAGEVAEGVVDIGDLASGVAGEGCLPVALGIAVVVLVAAACWWFFGGFVGAASAAMLEAGAEALLAAAVARAAAGGAGNWIDGALRASWKYWLGLGLAAALLGAIASALHPGAQTLYQAFFGA